MRRWKVTHIFLHTNHSHREARRIIWLVPYLFVRCLRSIEGNERTKGRRRTTSQGKLPTGTVGYGFESRRPYKKLKKMAKLKINAEVLLNVTVIEPDQTEHICVTEFEYLDLLAQIAEQKLDGCKLLDNGKLYDIDKGRGAVQSFYCGKCEKLYREPYTPKGSGQFADTCLKLMRAQVRNRIEEKEQSNLN
jgi:hypothetical protein